MPGQDPSDFSKQVKEVLQSMPAGSLLMSDLFGGTPANVSAAVSGSNGIAAICGLSLSMLIEAVCSRANACGEVLANAVVQAGKAGCQNILAVLSGLEDDGH